MHEASLQDSRLGMKKQYLELNCAENLSVRLFLLILCAGRALNSYEHTCTYQIMAIVILVN